MLNAITSFSYGLIIAGAFVLGSFLLWKNSKKEGLEPDAVFDWIILILIFGIIFGRLVFIAEHFNVYSEDIFRWIHFIRFPGISSKGLILGGLLVSILYFRKIKQNIWIYLDLAVLPLLYVWFLAQTACMINGCVEASGFKMPGEFVLLGFKDMVYPVNLYYLMTILFQIYIFKYLKKIKFEDVLTIKSDDDKSRNKPRHGIVFLIFIILYFSSGLILENFLANTLYLMNVSLKLVFNLAGLLISLFLLNQKLSIKYLRENYRQIIDKLKKGTKDV